MADRGHQHNGEVGSLRMMLEASQTIRSRLLHQNHFTQWLSEQAIGVKSVKAMTLNCTALEIMAEWWCSQHPDAVTAAKIQPLRDEVGL